MAESTESTQAWKPVGTLSDRHFWTELNAHGQNDPVQQKP